MADRFYCPETPRDGRIVLDRDEARHLARVARRQEGDVVEVFDGQGRGFLACVASIARDQVILHVVEPVEDRAQLVTLTVAVALPKGDRADWLVEKATELGVSRLVPLLTERSVVDPRASKIERLKRTIIEASKQCGRNRLMTLDAPRPLSDYLEQENASARLFAHASGLSQAEWPKAHAESAALAVGPEGGWSDSEIAIAVARGWTLVNLGPTRLRVETAAIVGASLIFGRSERTSS